MAISSTTRSAGPFLGTGAPLLAAPFTFKVFSASDLRVTRTTAGVVTPLVLNADYTVTLNIDQDAAPGGTISTTGPSAVLAVGSVLYIDSEIADTQSVVLTSGGPYLPKVIENALDRVTALIQQLRVKAGRTLRVSDAGGLAELPGAAERANKTLTFNSLGQPIVTVPAAGSASALATDLASSANASTGAGMVATGLDLPGASATTQHVVNEYREVIATVDFGVPNNGAASATAAIQTMFDSCAAAGNVRDILFPDGTYLLTNPRNDAQGTCAVVIGGLKKCRIRGGKNTKFIVNASGAGASQFGMFRIENGNEDLEFCHFEADGSGIVNTGVGANRSASFIIANFDQNTQATDLTPNKRLEFHHLYIHDIGGGPNVLPRTASLPPAPMTEGLSVHDCKFKNLTNVNHGVAACFVRNLDVRNNEFVQDFAAITPIDTMAVDASRGCINAIIDNNYVYGFSYGIKCETQNNAGPSGTEQRPSYQTRITNNRLEQMGNPTSFLVGGDTTFGIRANGVDVVVDGNTVEARTIGVTTGGLGVGLIAVNTHLAESHVVVTNNRVQGPQTGLIQGDTTAATRECTVEIHRNKFVDCLVYGASLANNVTFDDNWIIRAGRSGVEIQGANLTFVRRNKFIDCASSDNLIIPERVAAVYQDTPGASTVIAGYTEILDNVVIDTRGASAAEYAYFLRASSTLTNELVFRPGFTKGMLTATAYDSNFNVVGDTLMIGGINRPGPRTFLATGSPQSVNPWQTLAWNTGDRAIRFPPLAGSPKAWVCTVAGTPGTWVSEGNL